MCLSTKNINKLNFRKTNYRFNRPCRCICINKKRNTIITMHLWYANKPKPFYFAFELNSSISSKELFPTFHFQKKNNNMFLIESTWPFSKVNRFTDYLLMVTSVASWRALNGYTSIIPRISTISTISTI